MADIEQVAGIVRTEADEILEKVEAALDAQEFRNEFLEGVRLPNDELERRRCLLARIAMLVNSALEGKVVIVGAYPEEDGRGARFVGVDRESRRYTIDLHLEAEVRMAHGRIDHDRDVREAMGLIVAEVLRQRARYFARMT